MRRREDDNSNNNNSNNNNNDDNNRSSSKTTTTIAQYPRGGEARASYKYIVICNSPLNTYISNRRDGFDYNVVR